MDSIVHADIFFFITAVAVIFLTVMVAIALYYLIQILANFRKVTDILRSGAENAQENIKNINDSLKNNPFIKMFFGRKAKSKKSKSK